MLFFDIPSQPHQWYYPDKPIDYFKMFDQAQMWSKKHQH
jgi:hypothetical protein